MKSSHDVAMKTKEAARIYLKIFFIVFKGMCIAFRKKPPEGEMIFF